MSDETLGPPKLSRATWLLVFLGVPLLFIALLIVSPLTAACLPFLALPTAVILRFRSQLTPAERPDLETLIWTFFISGTLGMVVVGTIQAILGYGLALLLFGARTDEYLKESGRTNTDDLSADDRQRRAAMVWTWQYLAMLLLFAFVLAALLEEAMKYIAVSYIRRRRRTSLEAQEYIGYIIAAALGFSLTENIGFVFSSTRADSVYMTALTVAERVTFSSPGHALMGVLTAINMIRRDLQQVPLKTWRILCPSVLYHGMFNVATLGMSAADGNVGFIHPTEPSRVLLLLVLVSSMFGTLAWHVRRAYRNLDLEE